MYRLARINPSAYSTALEVQRDFQRKVLMLMDVVDLIPENVYDKVSDAIGDLGPEFDEAIKYSLEPRVAKGAFAEIVRKLNILEKIFQKFTKTATLSHRVAFTYLTGGQLSVADLPGLFDDLRALCKLGLELTAPTKPRAKVPEAPATAKDDPTSFNTVLAKELQKLKKDAGAESIAQNYRGTGSQVHRRQLWVRFKSGAVIDLWLEKDSIRFGGVVMNAPPGGSSAELPGGIMYRDDSPAEVYKKAAPLLKAWATPKAV